MTAAADLLAPARRVVVKIGSSLLIGPDRQPHAARFSAIAADLNALAGRGVQIVLVSSGAVALGRSRLGFGTGRLNLEQKQAAAAAGQTALMQAWDAALAPRPAAQALLTSGDLESRRRWLNARATLDTLLAAGAQPVINENDTVATDELRYGDNDRLAARVAQMCDADALILLSDVAGLFTSDPGRDPSARLLDHVPAISPEIEAMAGGAGAAGTGTGGMASKIAAARIAGSAGIGTIIAAGAQARPVLRLFEGGEATAFSPETSRQSARRAWIAGAFNPAGTLTLDAGAVEAVRKGRSLLPAGVSSVSGRFQRGEAVRLLGPDGEAVGKGVVGYASDEVARIAGLQSGQIEAALGWRRGAALVHASDLVLDPA
ncbi:glutamate 5-kinase [Glycocaulis profundi]|nr:glutamate 5-kinase [Glycocaulis profundi]